ncbi:uncharacterized protein K452DRAFT_356532 [Aplosporella prunicola CBS 121167]|uniref:Uncharacterized protein n=1 Tax=Aplosporella prunicola CBS 121167 TaxID=1176127 RepID=A0A6A6BP81_9PEZI|nr:uncharacterized protein K452DRAFT_356532 [Aplosporella prunicola CBS 121167]KAF2145253.1 hypothetical protein K452DRAFT_356532 [Aplosporella prunicola CBS 121167]
MAHSRHDSISSYDSDDLDAGFGRPAKRARVADGATATDAVASLTSFVRDINPPARAGSAAICDEDAEAATRDGASDAESTTADESEAEEAIPAPLGETEFVSSPIELTRIRDLPAAANRDTVSLGDILCDPMIAECWQFNYTIDVDFIMENLDPDVREMVRLKVVHGTWRKEDPQWVRLEESKKRYPNLEVIQAYMPEPFGTHHSKMMVLFRHDDSAQVIIHTANMIRQDWRNLTQAIWRSPLLPLLSKPPNSAKTSIPTPSSTQQPPPPSRPHHPIGSGARFQTDLLRYLAAYGRRTLPLRQQLQKYDFSAVRAALVASTPSRVKLDECDPAAHTSWGWPGLREVLRCIPICDASSSASSPSSSSVIAQVSSIATLGQTDTWLRHFHNVLSSHAPTAPTSTMATPTPPPPRLKIVWPTADEVRTSLDGYASGASIHLKAQSAAQMKQLAYLRPMMCRWAGQPAAQLATPPSSGGSNGISGAVGSSERGGEGRGSGAALRGPAAPHIKTYTRVSGGSHHQRVEWALLTSANLSTQAWGALPTAPKPKSGGSSNSSSRNTKKASEDEDETGKDVRVCSYEIGVVLWPALWSRDGADAAMVPVFGRNVPCAGDVGGVDDDGEGGGRGGGGGGGSSSGSSSSSGSRGGESAEKRASVVVGWRAPYDVPLAAYSETDEPWCPGREYQGVDVKGCVWQGWGA